MIADIAIWAVYVAFLLWIVTIVALNGRKPPTAVVWWHFALVVVGLSAALTYTIARTIS